MRVISKVLPRTHKIVYSGDWHIGSMNTAENDIDEMVAKVKEDKKTYFVGMGDYIEGITVDDKRYCAESTRNGNIISQYDMVVEKLRPIANKIIGLAQGNHERKHHKMGNMIERLICRELKVPFLGYVSVVAIEDKKGNLQHKDYIWHGKSQFNSNIPDLARRRAAIQAAIKNALAPKQGDCHIMVVGHSHKLEVRKPEREIILQTCRNEDGSYYVQSDHTVGAPTGARGYIDPEGRYYVNSGSFMKLNGQGWDNYAEIAGYSPIELGYPIAIIEDGKIVNIEKRILS